LGCCSAYSSNGSTMYMISRPFFRRLSGKQHALYGILLKAWICMFCCWPAASCAAMSPAAFVMRPEYTDEGGHVGACVSTSASVSLQVLVSPRPRHGSVCSAAAHPQNAQQCCPNSACGPGPNTSTKTGMWAPASPRTRACPCWSWFSPTLSSRICMFCCCSVASCTAVSPAAFFKGPEYIDEDERVFVDAAAWTRVDTAAWTLLRGRYCCVDAAAYTQLLCGCCCVDAAAWTLLLLTV
jgi:hypothetical protein